jgi:hypothetical protein
MLDLLAGLAIRQAREVGWERGRAAGVDWSC